MRSKPLVALAALIAIGLVAGLALLSQRVRLQRLVIDRIIRELEPHLPFKIKKIEVDADWSEFRKGKFKRVDLLLEDPVRAISWRSSGPMALNIPGKTIQLTYSGNLQVSSPQVQIDTDFHGSAEILSDIRKHGIQLEAVEFKAPHAQVHVGEQAHPIPLKLEPIRMDLEWTPHGATASLAIPKWSWGEIGAAQKTTLEITWGGSDQKLKTRMRVETPELLWKSLYLDPKAIELLATTELADPRLDTRLDFRAPDWQIHLRAQIQRARRESTSAFDAQWTLETMPLATWVERLKSLPEAASALATWEIASGTLSAQGKIQSNRPLHTTVAIRKFTARARALSTVVRGDSVALKIDSHPITGGARGAQSQPWKFELAWGPTRIGVRKLSTRMPAWTGSAVWEAERGWSGAPIELPALSWSPIGLKIGPTRLDPATRAVATEVLLPELALKTVTDAACLTVPDLPFRLRIPLAHLTEQNGKLQGPLQIQADGFDGTITAQLDRGFDLDRAVPEWHGSIDVRALELQKIGDWLGFGKMRGWLEGHIHQGVWLGTYPTRMDLEIRAVPSSGRDIVFSPQAMKNFVKLFAGDELDAIPGIAQWFAFGWPSAVFGGYDVDYLGLQVESRDGILAIRTLDPPEVFERNQKPYILYGPRFRMPLQVKQLPLISDATAMANFVNRLSRQIAGMIAAKQNLKPSEMTHELCQPD